MASCRGDEAELVGSSPSEGCRTAQGVILSHIVWGRITKSYPNRVPLLAMGPETPYSRNGYERMASKHDLAQNPDEISTERIVLNHEQREGAGYSIKYEPARLGAPQALVEGSGHSESPPLHSKPLLLLIARCGTSQAHILYILSAFLSMALSARLARKSNMSQTRLPDSQSSFDWAWGKHVARRPSKRRRLHRAHDPSTSWTHLIHTQKTLPRNHDGNTTHYLEVKHNSTKSWVAVKELKLSYHNGYI